MSAAPAPAALLIDLDGVVRRFPPDVRHAVERRYGVAAGTVADAAFRPQLLDPVITGRCSHADWMAATAAALRDACPDPVALVGDWHADRGEVAPDVLDVVRAVRRSGCPVGLLTNATDWLDADLRRLGLAGEFDVVVNSSAIGVAKPDPGIFAAAARAVGHSPGACAYSDDTPGHVEAATAAGLRSRVFTSADDLAAWLGVRRPGHSPL